MADILDRDVNRRIGRAMHIYRMLADGDRVLVAVSGGIDSLITAWVLHCWRHKAPIRYQIDAVHIDMALSGKGVASRFATLQKQLAAFGVTATKEPAAWRPDVSGERDGNGNRKKNICFACARNRRNQLFAIAEKKNYSKIAFGHHKDDIIETFFLNLLFSGNISTMVPRQDLFAGRLSLIRPLAFLEKDEIIEIGNRLGIRPAVSGCPLAERTRRLRVRKLLKLLYSCFPGSKASIFAALANVRRNYLLK